MACRCGKDLSFGNWLQPPVGEAPSCVLAPDSNHVRVGAAGSRGRIPRSSPSSLPERSTSGFGVGDGDGDGDGWRRMEKSSLVGLIRQ